MKLSSSVVTTSSTPSRAFISAGPSSSSRAGQCRASIISGNSTATASRPVAAMHAAHGDGGQRAGIELAFGADVEQPRLEGHGGGQAGQDQRDRAREGFAPGEHRAEAALAAGRRSAPPARRPTAPAGADERGEGDRADRRQQQGERKTGARAFKPHGLPLRPSPGRSLRASIPMPGAARPQWPCMHHRDAVAQRQHFVQVVGDQQHRRAGIARGEQLLLHIGHGADVQAPGRLVRDDQARRRAVGRQQRAAEDQLLHVAAGQARAGEVEAGAAHVEGLDARGMGRARRAAGSRPRAKTRRAQASATAFSHTGRSPTTPTPCRSSGMRARPWRTSCAGCGASGRPDQHVPRCAGACAAQHFGQRSLAVARHAGNRHDLAPRAGAAKCPAVLRGRCGAAFVQHAHRPRAARLGPAGAAAARPTGRPSTAPAAPCRHRRPRVAASATSGRRAARPRGARRASPRPACG
jgi:hypothetical protein